jgi:hypothetical protein
MKVRHAAGGIKKEVVTEYEPRGGGTVVPTAPDDDRGGRSDLTGNTMLPPPVDDPNLSEDIVWPPPETPETESAPVSAPPARQTAQQPVATPPQVPALAPPPVPLMPDVVTKPGPEDVGPAEPVSKTKVKLTQEQVEELLEMIAAERLKPPRTVTTNMSISGGGIQEVPAEATFVQVILEGDFGRFHSKVSDVKICERHVALVYTGRSGDDGLRFEPRLDQPFVLKMELEDHTYREFHVAHFGLVTPLDDLGATLVVLPFVEVPQSPEQEQEQGLEQDVD